MAQTIYEAIVALVNASTFVPVVYSNVGGPALERSALDESQAVAPKSCVLNEIRATYREAKRNRRAQTYERDQWVWELFLDFDREVSLEDFENRFLDRGLVIPADPQRGTSQVNVTLASAPFYHPPQSQASNGTYVRFTLIASVHPK
jgi:hypothetical protein